MKPRKKPYIVTIITPKIDPNDHCPLLDFHIAVKPIEQIPHENLRCFGYKIPPAVVEIDESQRTTKVESFAAFSSEWIQRGHQGNSQEYDIEIDLPHSDYMIDAELKTDFLTNRM